MDTDQPTEIQAELSELLDTADISRHLSPEQKQELVADLELAIIVEMSGELLENLSEEGKKLLEEEHFQGYNSLLVFLKKTSSPEAYARAIGRATDLVLGEFLKKTAV